MSVPYYQLQRLAAAHRPSLPINPDSTWIAVLLHTIEDVDEVQSGKDFVWVKCHGVSLSPHVVVRILQ